MGMLERAAGFEPATTCLGSKDSTTELRPLTAVIPCTPTGSLIFIQEHPMSVQAQRPRWTYRIEKRRMFKELLANGFDSVACGQELRVAIQRLSSPIP